METYLNMALAYIPRVIGFLALLLIAWVLSGWVRSLLQRSLTRAKLDTALVHFLTQSVKILVLMCGFVMGMSVFGVETASLAAIMGSVGVAIGLALQGTLSNFAAGVMLLLFRPFKVGDHVMIEGELGIVAEIDLFSTALDTLDYRRIILPNSKVFGNRIENRSFHPLRRCDVRVVIDPDENIEETRRVLETAARAVLSASKERTAKVVLQEFTNEGMAWDVRTWAKPNDFYRVKEDTVTEVKRALAAANIKAVNQLETKR